MDDQASSNTDLVELSGEIVAAYVAHNALSPTDLPRLLADVHAALRGLASGTPAPAETKPLAPAVPVRRSVTPDHLVCLDCGKDFKSLRRHLMAQHAQTPEQYRQRWSLAADYPMVAPNYSEVRSTLARESGLGRGAA